MTVPKTSPCRPAGIARTGDPGSYRYAVLDNDGSNADRPITYVTWFDAARFANWMANGQPSRRAGRDHTENGAHALNGAVSGRAVVKNSIDPDTGSAPAFAPRAQPHGRGGEGRRHLLRRRVVRPLLEPRRSP